MVDILQESGAEDYIPRFARHRVSIETMMQMGMDELREVGNGFPGQDQPCIIHDVVDSRDVFCVACIN